MRDKLPNIIFVVMDTLGAKHMSLYGYHRRTTPNFEIIAEETTLYPHCYAPSCWTIPSHASMFTGLLPSQHGAFEGKFRLSDEVQYVGSSLKMRGYKCYGLSANPLVTGTTGLIRNFDFFSDFDAARFADFIIQGLQPEQKFPEFKNRSAYYLYRIKNILLEIWNSPDRAETVENLISFIKNKYSVKPWDDSNITTTKSFHKATELLEKHEPSAPFFLFLNLMDVHEKYNPPKRMRQFSRKNDQQTLSVSECITEKNMDLIKQQSVINHNLYDDAILNLDQEMMEFWSYCKKQPFFENTLFIFTSDHGEHFGEKNRFGHTLSLYNELIWVPLIIKFPNEISKNAKRDERIISLSDLYSTILDIIASPLPRPETSLSLLEDQERDYLISEIVFPEAYAVLIRAIEEKFAAAGKVFSPPSFAMITKNNLKLIKNRNTTFEVYNLKNDQDENENIFSKNSEVINNYIQFISLLEEETGYAEAAEHAKLSLIKDNNESAK
jgi:arylsulfatase A-like enzyme